MNNWIVFSINYITLLINVAGILEDWTEKSSNHSKFARGLQSPFFALATKAGGQRKILKTRAKSVVSFPALCGNEDVLPTLQFSLEKF